MDFASLKAKAKQLKSEVYALYLASKDPRTPWYAKVLAVLIIGYALSPIDLIPDFIPVLGYLDDLIIVPAGVVLLLKMIPKEVMEDDGVFHPSHHDRAKAAGSRTCPGTECKNM